MRRLALASLVLLAACQGAESERPAVTVRPQAVERSRAEAGKDDTLKAQVTRAISALDRRAYRAVTVEVFGGRALLMGAVIKPEQRRKAEAAAKSVDGVTGVINELVLAEDKALDLFTPNPSLEETIRRKLGREVDGAAIRVINNVAFLLGAAPSNQAADSIKAEATDVDGVKWVVAHFVVQ